MGISHVIVDEVHERDMNVRESSNQNACWVYVMSCVIIHHSFHDDLFAG